MTRTAIKLLMAAALTPWIGACAAGETGEDEPRPAAAALGPVTSEPPPGAIRRGKDFYLVPIGADGDGCMRYRTFSLTRLVAQVIYYDDGEGGYTPNKAAALCAEVK